MLIYARFVNFFSTTSCTNMYFSGPKRGEQKFRQHPGLIIYVVKLVENFSNAQKKKTALGNKAEARRNARNLTICSYVDPADMKFKDTMTNARKKLATQLRNHEDLIADQRSNSLNPVHKPFTTHQAMKIPGAKAEVEEKWTKHQNLTVWQVTQVKSKKSHRKKHKKRERHFILVVLKTQTAAFYPPSFHFVETHVAFTNPNAAQHPTKCTRKPRHTLKFVSGRITQHFAVLNPGPSPSCSQDDGHRGVCQRRAEDRSLSFVGMEMKGQANKSRCQGAESEVCTTPPPPL